MCMARRDTHLPPPSARTPEQARVEPCLQHPTLDARAQEEAADGELPPVAREGLAEDGEDAAGEKSELPSSRSVNGNAQKTGQEDASAAAEEVVRGVAEPGEHEAGHGWAEKYELRVFVRDQRGARSVDKASEPLVVVDAKLDGEGEVRAVRACVVPSSAVEVSKMLIRRARYY